jgi:proteasome accessory factor C
MNRLLVLVPWLSARPGVTLSETAVHFCVSKEQLEKDLWQLVVCGLPGYGPDQLVDIDFWDDERIYVHDPQTLRAPLRLSQDEALALLLGLESLYVSPGMDGSTSVIGAREKLLAALGWDSLEVHLSLAKPDAQKFIEIIQDAIARGTKVRLSYASGTDGSLSDRLISPAHLFSVDGRTYVHAFCDSALDVRAFRVDRMISVEGTNLQQSQSADVTEVPESIGFGQTIATIRIREHDAWILDDISHVEVSLESDAQAGYLRCTLPFASEEWLIRWVMSRGGQVELLTPHTLRSEISRRSSDFIDRLERAASS